MASTSAASITLSLQENTLDFLQSAVAYIKTRDEHERCIKYGILHLCDGIELLLKCRLHTEHWLLIAENVDRTSQEDIKTGDFVSVTWQNAITRVEKVARKGFRKADKTLLEHLRKLRNRIQHFDVDVPKDVAVSLLAQGLHFATDFIEMNLRDEYDDLTEELHEIRVDLSGFDEFVAQRMKRLTKQLAKIREWSRTVLCPTCRQDALVADEEKATCLYCGYVEDGEDAADTWAFEFISTCPKDLMADDRIANCPECGADSCIDVGSIIGEGTSEYFCFSCGVTGHYDHCSMCNGLFEPDEEDVTCSPCFERFMEKD